MSVTPSRLCRLPEVVHIVGLSRSTIYDLIKKKKFPRQVRITPNTSGWPLEVIEKWVVERIAASDSDAIRQ